MVRGIPEVASSVLGFQQFVAVANARYKWFRHHKEIATAMEALVDGKVVNPVNGKPIRQAMILMPPRHGKSELVSRLFAAYQVFLFPFDWHAIASYGADLAYGFSKAARSAFQLNGGILDRSVRSVKQWQTEKGGGLWAAGLGGTITGRGFRLGIVDDPVKNAEEAQSPRFREKTYEAYLAAWTTREEGENAIEIIIQTRWHEADLAGQLLELERLECEGEDGDPEGWLIVDLPAICPAPEDRVKYPPSCVVWPDWRKPGEALWPEKYSAAKLNRIRRKIGEYFFQSLYLCNPRPKEGTFFMVSEVQFHRAVVMFGLPTVRAWDLAATENDGDWTVGVKMAGPDPWGRFYILDVVRFRHEPNKRDKRIRLTAELDGLMVKQVFPDDPGAGGKAASASLLRLLAGFNVVFKPVPSSAGKMDRATPLASQFNGGNVSIASLVAAPWETILIEEFRSFRGLKGDTDDIIDAAADAFNELANVSFGGFAGA